MSPIDNLDEYIRTKNIDVVKSLLCQYEEERNEAHEIYQRAKDMGISDRYAEKTLSDCQNTINLIKKAVNKIQGS